MRDDLVRALEATASGGADYADARLVDGLWETVRTERLRVTDVKRGAERGAAVRVRKDGAWGFAAGTDTSGDGLRLLAITATENARAGALLFSEPTELAPIPAVEAEWQGPVEIDPFTATVDERAELLFAAEHATRRLPAVRTMRGHVSASYQRKVFANTEGSFITQGRTVTGVGCRAMADTRDGRASRAFPQAGRGHFASGGLEIVQGLDLVAWGERAAEEATMLVTAPPCPADTRDLVLSGSLVALLLHETVGHLAEMDNLGPGTSQIALDDRDHRQFGAERVSITADSTLDGGLGTWGFDDEGVPAGRWPLVTDGVWGGFFTSRESAGRAGLDAGWGSVRAGSFRDVPGIRMSNVSLEPGSETLDDLITACGLGVLIDTPLHITIDRQTGWFRCEAEIGWEIERGRVRQIVDSPAFEGTIADFWLKCEGIARDDHHGLWSVTDCVKGTAASLLASSHGAAPARFRQCRVSPWKTRPPGPT